MKGAYYNEIDPFAAQWLRNLIAAGHIAPGDVDDRSIVEVKADDLAGYNQCHFFAGIGGWSLALRLAGWPDDRPVWTGSCPCQPFSSAGQRKGANDVRHLWPDFRRLIADGHPPVAFGEQVASADGREWLAGVRADLEALGYEVGAADLCAAGVGAPHIRQRLYWVAESEGVQLAGAAERRLNLAEVCESGENRRSSVGRSGGAVGMEHPESHGREQGWAEPVGRCVASGRGTVGLGDADEPGSQRRIERWDRAGERTAGATGLGHWDAFDLIPCRDGKSRRVEPGTFPLAHGVPNRVGLLRGYGNAIVPQVAAEFIAAYLEAVPNG